VQNKQANLEYLSLATVSQLIEQKKISPVEVVKSCLNKIEQLNPTINAFIEVTAEPALTQAEEAEAEIRGGNWRGPLHGIPVGVKRYV